MNNHVLVKIHAYSAISLLDRLKAQNINIYNLKTLTDDTYLLEVDLINEGNIKKIYPDLEIIKHYGLFGRLRNLFIKKITLVAFLLSLVFFFDFHNRIAEIKIYGTNNYLNTHLKARVDELGLVKYARIPAFNKLKEIEDLLKQEYLEEIDFVEVRCKGTIVNIKYQVRKESVDIPKNSTALYAKKNGIISHYVLTSGLKMVEEGQYVTKGTLLVADTIVDVNGNSIYLGVYGQVYATTWTIIEIKEKTTEDEASSFLSVMQKAKEKMCQGFVLEEKILNEKVLKYEYKNNSVYLKIHFTCLESIGI